MNNSVEQECYGILRQPCPFTKPPFTYTGGHSFCPCVLKVLRTAYIGGYKDGRAGCEPEVGIKTADPKDVK